MEAFILGLIVFICSLFVIRLFGAWMLRIDEVITLQKEIIKTLNDNHKSLGVTKSIADKAKMYDDMNENIDQELTTSNPT